MRINSTNIDRYADRAGLKSNHHRYPNETFSISPRTMALDVNHHWSVLRSINPGTMPILTATQSPVCSKKGNRRCVKLGHLIECEIHRGKYHSRIHECVSCAEACAREEKAAKKDHGSCNAEEKNKQQQKRRKSGKVKGVHEKTMKQLRKEVRDQKRKSSSD
ncbi:hypothetical protein FJTKL_13900 [Diaporthe vaccinii]|uniref:Uncharacterized protein n=1 Tax=Diaporthe vaccinii TaxID=105482 RepID=A0ABR4F9A6_9PEZI